MSIALIHPIIEAIQQAAQLCRTVQSRYLTQLAKTGNEPVTIADYGVQAILCRTISQYFPDDAVIAEERGDEFRRTVTEQSQLRIATLVGEILGEPITPDDLMRWLDYGRNSQAECTWVIDPIDGTRGFLASRRYVIGIGVLEGGVPMGGFLGCPEHGNQLLYAWDGLAFSQSLDGGYARHIQVSERTPPERLHVVEGSSGSVADQNTVNEIYRSVGIVEPTIHRIDAQLDSYGLIANGDADFFVCRPITRCSSKIWDHAAGVALVEAAGGRVTDLEGNALDFSQGERLTRNNSLLITNGRIHEQVLQALERVSI